VILYGFTRSNPERSVGFLKELRRVNVAITRVKQQLVMVGDLDTLTRARDRRFAALARSLRAHLDDNGEVVPYQTVRDRLEETI
jgi:superfamily I DNA and/or RNA helicase